jgi:hypothetical protein
VADPRQKLTHNHKTERFIHQKPQVQSDSEQNRSEFDGFAEAYSFDQVNRRIKLKKTPPPFVG